MAAVLDTADLDEAVRAYHSLDHCPAHNQLDLSCRGARHIVLCAVCTAYDCGACRAGVGCVAKIIKSRCALLNDKLLDLLVNLTRDKKVRSPLQPIDKSDLCFAICAVCSHLFARRQCSRLLCYMQQIRHVAQACSVISSRIISQAITISSNLHYSIVPSLLSTPQN